MHVRAGLAHPRCGPRLNEHHPAHEHHSGPAPLARLCTCKRATTAAVLNACMRTPNCLAPNLTLLLLSASALCRCASCPPLQRLEQFGAVFSAAYASALSLPPSHFAVDAVQCGGQAMQPLPGGSVGNSSTLAGPARALLREALAQQSGGRWLLQEPSRLPPQQQQPTQLAPTKSAGARQTQADVAARFRIPAPDGLAAVPYTTLTLPTT